MRWIVVALLVFVGFVMLRSPHTIEHWLTYLTLWGFFLGGLWVLRED